jgi:hypothetical protein
MRSRIRRSRIKQPKTRLRAGLAVALAAAALVISGCQWGSYKDSGYGDNLFVVHQYFGDNLIWNCTKNFGVSGRAKCVQDFIWATCQQDGQGDDGGWPYCYDATRTTHRADMETAIEGVVGKYDCLSYIEGNFDSAPVTPTSPTFVDDYFDPATGAAASPKTSLVVFQEFWQGVAKGTFGCP